MYFVNGVVLALDHRCKKHFKMFSESLKNMFLNVFNVFLKYFFYL